MSNISESIREAALCLDADLGNAPVACLNFLQPMELAWFLVFTEPTQAATFMLMVAEALE